MRAAAQPHVMHAQAKPAGRKLKYQESKGGASGPADDVASEHASPGPEVAANPSLTGHERAGHHGNPAGRSAGGREPHGEPENGSDRPPDLVAAAGPAE